MLRSVRGTGIVEKKRREPISAVFLLATYPLKRRNFWVFLGRGEIGVFFLFLVGRMVLRLSYLRRFVVGCAFFRGRGGGGGFSLWWRVSVCFRVC